MQDLAEENNVMNRSSCRWRSPALDEESLVSSAASPTNDEFDNANSPTAVYATSSMIESVRKSQEQNSVILLSRAVEICKERLIKAETMILDGDPKDMICQAAEQIHPHLLIVGSRDLGTIKRHSLELGSVSDYCVHHAKCPILIVKPPPK